MKNEIQYYEIAYYEINDYELENDETLKLYDFIEVIEEVKRLHNDGCEISVYSVDSDGIRTAMLID